MTLRVLISGGGTGGHVFPALAIKQHLVARCSDVEVLFVGTRLGLESTLLPRLGERLKTLWISGLSRGRPLANLLLPLKLVVSAVQSWRIIKSFRPHVVVGTGGYAMAPVVWVAQRMGIATILQEQNSFPGLTTRKLAKWATLVCLGYEAAASKLPFANCVVTGNPLRTSFRAVSRAEARISFPVDQTRKTLLVFGGSAGARSINRAVAESLPSLLERFNLIWQTGRSGPPEQLRVSDYKKAQQRGQLWVMPFIDDMFNAYAVSDLAICRAGAMTLAELAVTGLPAILVPYPFAADDHQTANAQSVAQSGAAMIIRDGDLNPQSLLSAVDMLCGDNTLVRMSSAMRSLARPDAGQIIADRIIQLGEHQW